MEHPLRMIIYVEIYRKLLILLFYEMPVTLNCLSFNIHFLKS